MLKKHLNGFESFSSLQETLVELNDLIVFGRNLLRLCSVKSHLKVVAYR